MKRDADMIDQIVLRQDITAYVRNSYNGWDSSLQAVINATGDYVRRPIYSLPVDFGWVPRPGITLIGDAAHLMLTGNAAEQDGNTQFFHCSQNLSAKGLCPVSSGTFP